MTPPVSVVRYGGGVATDFKEIWRLTIHRYGEITKTDLKSLSSAKSVDDILAEIHGKESLFKSRRHDNSKVDKFRTLVSRSLKPIQVVTEVVGQGASEAFPPGMAIFTAVRYLISTVNTVSADYDKITEFFEDLDAYLGRLKVLESRIPSIPELENALVEVLTSVLILCAISARYIKTRRIVKAFRNLVSGEDEELASAYATFHKAVEREQGIVRNAILVAVEQHRKETDRHHQEIVADTGYMKTIIANREATSEREKALKGLSSLNFHERQRDTFAKRHDGTCQWVLESNEFQQWAMGNQKSTLWCRGIPGSGKSVVTLQKAYESPRSVAVNYVSEVTAGTNSAVVHLYCDYKSPETQSETQLLSSVARQLAEKFISVPQEVKEFLDKGAEKKRNPSADEWVSLIQSLCRRFEETYILVDALDECPEQPRDRFLRSIMTLESSVRFLFSSRPHVDLPAVFDSLVLLEISASNSDIEAYLESELKISTRLSKLIAKDPTLKRDIMDHLNRNASGMFLLVHLQMNCLRAQNSPKMVRKAIATMPAEIDETYQNAMERIEAQGMEDLQLAKMAFSYIFRARRPLKVEELQHALGVATEDTDFDEDALPDMGILLAATAGLIRVDEKSNVIGLIHQTLHEYFEKNPCKLLVDPDAEFAKACLGYLSFDMFNEGPLDDAERLEQRLNNYHFLEYASHNWGYHLMEQLPGQSELAMSYLTQSMKLATSIQVLHVTPFQTKLWVDRFPKFFGPLHAAAYWGLQATLHRLLRSDISVDSQDSYGATPLLLAAKNGHLETVETLLKAGADMNMQTNSGGTSLYWAARNGHQNIVQLLLQRGAEITQDNDGWSALNWAILSGPVELASLLFENCLFLDARHGGQNQALFLAAEEGKQEMVQMLLSHGVDVNAEDWSGSTALDFASTIGHGPTIRVLLQNGADINSKDRYQNSALHWAVPHEETVRLLLENGADVNSKNDCGQTALCWTAQGGSVPVAELLIAMDANVNSQDKNGVTPIHRAALRGSEEMVRLLLGHGANPNLKDKNGWTALHGAWLKSHGTLVHTLQSKVYQGEETIESLLAQTEDPKQRAALMKLAEEKCQGSTVLTGLRFAAQEGQVGRLQTMLEKGAEVNAKDSGGYTALELAVYQRHQEAVRVLLEHGADANIPGSGDCPPLVYAIENADEDMVCLLIRHGANASAPIRGSAPIIMAAETGSLQIMQHLAEARVDVSVKDYSGQTALHLAALNGYVEIQDWLIDQQVDPNIADYQGKTALMLAIENSQCTAMKSLLSRGASTKQRMKGGATSLHLATFVGKKKMIRMVLESGADVNASTQECCTPLHIAAFLGLKAVARVLLKNGAQLSTRLKLPRVRSDERQITGQEAEREVDFLSKLVSDMVLESQRVSLEMDAEQGLTAEQLAKIGGYVSVQRLLRSHARNI